MLSVTKNFQGKFLFENISTLAKIVLTLPHSNAETERIFSMLSDTKTKKGNKMGPKLLKNAGNTASPTNIYLFTAAACMTSNNIINSKRLNVIH